LIVLCVGSYGEFCVQLVLLEIRNEIFRDHQNRAAPDAPGKGGRRRNSLLGIRVSGFDGVMVLGFFGIVKKDMTDHF